MLHATNYFPVVWNVHVMKVTLGRASNVMILTNVREQTNVTPVQPAPTQQGHTNVHAMTDIQASMSPP